MSVLSQFAPFSGGGIKSIQTGYIAVVKTTGSGEDLGFADVGISAVTTAKSVPNFYGILNNQGGPIEAMYSYDGAGTGFASGIIFPRLTSSTNLRLSSNFPTTTGSRINGRWYVVESN